ncbi:MAG: hypothetical protein SO152_02390 [Ruminococcus sp.]|nr:hypothetical protein [Ruminococcus sp.]
MNKLKKGFAVFSVVAILMFSTVAVSAKTYESPTATTSPNGVNNAGDNKNRNGNSNNGNSNNGNTGNSSTSPVTGDMTLYAILAAAGFGGVSFLSLKKLSAKR